MTSRDATTPTSDIVEKHLSDVQLLLARQRRVEALVRRQEMPKHALVEGLVHRQHLVELGNLLRHLSVADIANVLEALPEEDRNATWEEIDEERSEQILELVSDEVRAEVSRLRPVDGVLSTLAVYELKSNRLNRVHVGDPRELAKTNPVWVDLLRPTVGVRTWVGNAFDIEISQPEEAADIEESARFYIDDNGAVHMRSDFLLGQRGEARNVAVAFILHRTVLFSVRNEELPVFRLQRVRARAQPGSVSEGRDILLDLYGAAVEYSADALELIYADLERIGRRVLQAAVTDEEAAALLAEITQGEDLNGRIRRNLLDTRRALSFLMRSRLLSPEQAESARQILRDIESLDGHTSFLFNKINFLMDATVGFISINQNRRLSRLTTMSVVFVPMSIIASIGGMSEFSMMTQGLPWQAAYGAFVLAMIALGLATYYGLRFLEGRKVQQTVSRRRRESA